jgi:hypothetical protein
MSALLFALQILSTVSCAALSLAVYFWVRYKPVERIMAQSLTERVVKLCQSDDTVSGELAKDPTLPPHKAAHKFYGQHAPSVVGASLPEAWTSASKEELERASTCGKFGDQGPSELFLRIYHDALKTLEHDPLMGCVSPPLMGSTGVVPLTIVGSMHDICRHMVPSPITVSSENYLIITILPSRISSLAPKKKSSSPQTTG